MYQAKGCIFGAYFPRVNIFVSLYLMVFPVRPKCVYALVTLWVRNKAIVVLAYQQRAHSEGFPKDCTRTFYSFPGLQSKPESLHLNGTFTVKE